jgi:hypothetical protein
MPDDGLPVRAASARAAVADRPESRRFLAAGIATIALIAAACSSTSSSGGVGGATGVPSTTTSEAPSVEVSAAPSAAQQGFLTFQEQNASKVFGGGTATDLGDGSSAITLGIVAVGYTDPLPARLVAGACTDAASAPLPSYAPPPSAAASGAASAAPSVAAPSAAASAAASMSASELPSLPAESSAPTPATLPIDLTPVSAGGSNTVVQLPVAQLLSSPSSVLLYKSMAEPTLVACSDITATLVIPSSSPGAVQSAEPSAMASEAALPSGSTTP